MNYKKMSSLFAVSFTVAVAACGSGTGTGTGTPAVGNGSNNPSGGQALNTSSSPIRIMPTAQHLQAMLAAQPNKKTSGNTLSYYGGPVIENVKVFVVQWGAKISIPWSSSDATVTDLGNFFSGVTNSSYWTWLAEYNTSSPKQTIGPGSYIGTYVDTDVSSTGTVDDTAIQAELSRLVSAGSVPANDGNTLYFFYFPPNLTVTEGGDSSCEVFCAYHGTGTDSSGNDLYYGVIPDQGGSCAGGCGNASTQFDNTTSVTSHELVEATTDAGVGLATGNAAPLAWYNQTNGEIGDICNAQQGNVTDSKGNTWTVQLLWSNYDNACVSSSKAPAGSGATSSSTTSL